MPFRVLCRNETGKWEEVGLVVDDTPLPRVGDTFFLGQFKNAYKVLHVYRGWRFGAAGRKGQPDSYTQEHIPFLYAEKTKHPEAKE